MLSGLKVLPEVVLSLKDLGTWSHSGRSNHISVRQLVRFWTLKSTYQSVLGQVPIPKIAPRAASLV